MSACGSKYLCGYTLIDLHSFLDGAERCAIKSGPPAGSAQVVELSNLGSGHYVVAPEGACDEPLRFPDSTDPRAWKTETPFRLPPVRRADAKRISWRLEATEPLRAGLVDPEVSTSVQVTGREGKHGGLLPNNRKIPPNDLSFSCAVE